MPKPSAISERNRIRKRLGLSSTNSAKKEQWTSSGDSIVRKEWAAFLNKLNKDPTYAKVHLQANAELARLKSERQKILKSSLSPDLRKTKLKEIESQLHASKIKYSKLLKEFNEKYKKMSGKPKKQDN